MQYIPHHSLPNFIISGSRIGNCPKHTMSSQTSFMFSLLTLSILNQDTTARNKLNRHTKFNGHINQNLAINITIKSNISTFRDIKFNKIRQNQKHIKVHNFIIISKTPNCQIGLSHKFIKKKKQYPIIHYKIQRA